MLALLPKVFAWARAAKPSQPLTSGVWQRRLVDRDEAVADERVQLEQSDVDHLPQLRRGAELEKRVGWLKRYNRPLLCTEYMARGNGSTFDRDPAGAGEARIAAYNWGFVAGKTQTHLPWDSWQKPYVDREPEVWFHDIFRGDGTPYRPAETELLKKLTAARATREPPGAAPASAPAAAPPRGRGEPRRPLERDRQPALGAEARVDGDRGERLRGPGDQLAGPGDPPRLDERTRREAGGHPEGAREVEHAQAGSGRQIGERQRTVEPGFDEDLDAPEGSRGQAAAQMR